MKANGTTYTLTLGVRDLAQQIREGKHQNGHLFVSCTRPRMENARDYGDWRFNITINNGEIQETKDLFMNEAPKTGYGTSINIIKLKGNSDYSHRLLGQRYFVVFNQGPKPIYSSLYVHITPFSNFQNEICRAKLYYKINMTGSQNLELAKG